MKNVKKFVKDHTYEIILVTAGVVVGAALTRDHYRNVMNLKGEGLVADMNQFVEESIIGREGHMYDENDYIIPKFVKRES